MSKILSQEEIDALLKSAAEIGRAARGVEAVSRDGVVRYNFRRPDRVSKEQMRALQLMHDRFARNVTTSLSAYLRTVTEVSLAQVEQVTYEEYLRSVSDPTAYYALTVGPLERLAALELNPVVAFTIIDRLLGGSGRAATLARALTEIEQNVIDGVVRLVAENLTESWRNVQELSFTVSGRETRPQMLQVAAANEVVVHLGFDIRIGDARGMLNLAIPAVAIESMGGSFAQPWEAARPEPAPADRRQLLDSLARVSLPVTASLDTTLPARELLALAPGDVLALTRAVQEPVDVRVQGTTKFAGQLVRRDGAAGVMVTATVNGAGAYAG